MAKKKSEPELRIVGEPEFETELQHQEEAPIKIELSFDAWWIMKAQSLKLKPELKKAVQKHFEARGFMASGDFDKGIIDFGV